eukprot:12033565-Alexandrium_andersonii.AAC.1
MHVATRPPHHRAMLQVARVRLLSIFGALRRFRKHQATKQIRTQIQAKRPFSNRRGSPRPQVAVGS